MMHSVRRLAVGSLLAATMAAVTGVSAAAALAAPAISAPSAAAAAPGAAVPAGRAGIGSFSNWRAAQRAARFGLRHPSFTAGLKRAEPVLVEKCLVTHELAKRNVLGVYGTLHSSLLVLEQNNSGNNCGNFGEAKVLGRYRVLGAKATLWGACGMAHMPSCHHKKITLFLTWRQHGIYRLASSYNEPGRTLVRFARGLRRVG